MFCLVIKSSCHPAVVCQVEVGWGGSPTGGVKDTPAGGRLVHSSPVETREPTVAVPSHFWEVSHVDFPASFDVGPSDLHE